jgi:hypothetical protein
MTLGKPKPDKSSLGRRFSAAAPIVRAMPDEVLPLAFKHTPAVN